MARKEGGSGAPDSGRVMAGVLALLVADREDRLNGSDPKYNPAKTEVMLAGAGLNANQIAAIMGKTTGAVQKTIQRGRKSGSEA